MRPGVLVLQWMRNNLSSVTWYCIATFVILETGNLPQSYAQDKPPFQSQNSDTTPGLPKMEIPWGITKRFAFTQIDNDHLILKEPVIEINEKGELHFTSEAVVSVGQQNCSGAISGTLTITFYNNENILLFRIDKPLSLDTGTKYLNDIQKHEDISKNFAWIKDSKISIETKIERKDCD